MDCRQIARAGGRAAGKRRLAFVITEDWWLWQHWVGLAKAARDAGYSVTIVTRVDAYGERIRECGFPLLNVDFARGRLSLWANLRTLFSRRRPEAPLGKLAQVPLLNAALWF